MSRASDRLRFRVYRAALEAKSQNTMAETFQVARSTIQSHLAWLRGQGILISGKKQGAIQTWRRGRLAARYEAQQGGPKTARWDREGVRAHRGRFVSKLVPDDPSPPEGGAKPVNLNGMTQWTWTELVGGKSWTVQLNAGRRNASVQVMAPDEVVTGPAEVEGVWGAWQKQAGALVDRMAGQYGWRVAGPPTRANRGPEFGVAVQGTKGTDRFEGPDGAAWADGSVAGGEFETSSDSIAARLTTLPTELDALWKERGDLGARLQRVLDGLAADKTLLERLVAAHEQQHEINQQAMALGLMPLENAPTLLPTPLDPRRSKKEKPIPEGYE